MDTGQEHYIKVLGRLKLLHWRKWVGTIRLRLKQSRYQSCERVLSGRFGQRQVDTIPRGPGFSLAGIGVGILDDFRRDKTLLSQPVSFDKPQLLCLME